MNKYICIQYLRLPSVHDKRYFVGDQCNIDCVICPNYGEKIYRLHREVRYGTYYTLYQNDFDIYFRPLEVDIDIKINNLLECHE